MRFLMVFLILVFGGQAAGEEWATIDFPESNYTDIRAIENGKIIGNHSIVYESFSYTYDGVEWETLDLPGGVSAADGNNIVGNDQPHGFLYDGVSVIPIVCPIMNGTSVNDIDGANIVGGYRSGDEGYGYIYDGQDWVTINRPGPARQELLYVTGIDGNKLVGNYWDPDSVKWRGFISEGNNWTFVDSPDGSPITVFGVDGDAVVGISGDHGFVLDGESWETIAFPGATLTEVFGRKEGKVFGRYRDDSSFYHGFIYTADPTNVEKKSMGNVKSMFR